MENTPQTGQREETCRICLESSPIANTSACKISRFTSFDDEDRLISPCACSGTHAPLVSAQVMDVKLEARNSSSNLQTTISTSFSFVPVHTSQVTMFQFSHT